MNKLATSTNIISFRRDGGKTPMVQLIPTLVQAGWTNLDLNFCEMMNPSSVLRTDDWKTYVQTLKELKQEHELTYMQAHAPYVNDRFALDKHQGLQSDALITRSIEAASMLGIPVVVLHPAKGDASTIGSSLLEKNRKWLAPFIEQATQLEVMIALENLDTQFEIHKANDLCDLIDSLESDHVGVCYDFGHAQLCGQDHVENIETYSDYLIATHVADNHGRTDEHLLPFYGTIHWESCMEALASIGYDGYLTYETMFFSQFLPEELKPSMLAHAKDVGNYLLQLLQSSERC